MSDASIERPLAREKWNQRYERKRLSRFGAPPAEWLLENRSVLVAPARARALDVACGAGRNAVYLAQLGFEVDAVDVSDVAIESLRAAAVERGLAINARQMDLEDDPLPVRRYDLIVQINYLQRGLWGPLALALRPGGHLVVETVTRAHIEELGASFDPRFVLDRNELLRSFPDLHVLHYREGVATRSGKPRAVASLVAQRRADR